MNEQPVLIAGAGVGGLSAGLALKARGIPVEIFEQADELRAAGAGITVQTNAMVVMEALGVDTALGAAGHTLEHGFVRDWRGRVLQELDIDLAHREFGAYGLAIHRKELLEVLAEALDATIHFGARVGGFEQAEEGVKLHLEEGPIHRGRALIGGDGLHSVVREVLRGDEPLRYSGYTTWRGVVEVDEPTEESTEYWGRGKRFGVVPIGRGRLYWFAVANAPAGGSGGPHPTKELLADFGDWVEPIPALLRATPDADVIRTDVYDRRPIERWGRGRVTLLGDAAHPMTPNLGQGACQAIEDAYVLAAELEAHGLDVEAGLRAYEERRRDRTAWFVRQSKRIGQVAQWENSLARWMRDVAARLTPERVTVEQVRKMYRPVEELV